MKNLTSKLIFLLVIQVFLVGLFLITGQQTQDYNQQNFLNLTDSDFDKILIEEGNKTLINEAETSKNITLSLDKHSNSWLLPENNNLPIAPNKINDVIDKLNSSQTSWPIATTQSSHERFEVAEDQFQRRLKFYKEDKLVLQLYLGTSPGFRKVHARLEGKDEIYSVSLNHFDLPTIADDWLNKSLLASDQILSIKGTDFELEKNTDQWRFASSTMPPEENLSLDETKATELANALTSLRVQSIAHKTPTLVTTSIEISQTNNSLRYDFFKDDENYFVSRNDIDSVFNINQKDYEKLTQFDRESLVQKEQYSKSELPEKEISESKLPAVTTDNS